MIPRPGHPGILWWRGWRLIYIVDGSEKGGVVWMRLASDVYRSGLSPEN